MADRYQAFSTELLRLALLGIAAFGFLYKEVFAGFDPSKHPNVDIVTAKCFASASIFFFGATAVFALIFQYCSSETVRLYLEGLRFVTVDKQKSTQKLINRRKIVYVCIITKLGAAVTLAVGAILTSFAFWQLLK